jgi:hypothetical protein
MRLFRLIIVLLALLCLVGSSWADGGNKTYPLMKPDKETFLRWVQQYELAPRASIDERLAAAIPPQGSLSLLSYLSYVPVERDQGICGNCWVWAGTGCMELALYFQKSITDRLSIQLLNSCDIPYACCGGWLSDLARFYTIKRYAVPWANTNAQWQDGGRDCADGSSARSCGSIDTATNYPITSIAAQTINTQGTGQATAISNIKNILSQNKGVWFAFFLPTTADWSTFFTFWNNQSEAAVWDPDTSCGKNEDAGFGGHAVLVVGYNDDDPNNKYWIALNSWGTTANRPNGVFRIKMNMNYDCTYKDGGVNYSSYYFQTLSMTWGNATWVAAYQTLFDNPADLALFRLYRDNVLGRSLEGKILNQLLYKNSEEALLVLISNPELLDWAARLVRANMDAVGDAASFGEGIIANTDEILSFLEAFALKSPPELKRLAETVMVQMMKKRVSGEPFFGFSLR